MGRDATYVNTKDVPDSYRHHVRRIEWDPQMRKGVSPEEVLSTGRLGNSPRQTGGVSCGTPY